MLAPLGSLTRCTKDSPEDLHNQALAEDQAQAQVTQTQDHQVTQTRDHQVTQTQTQEQADLDQADQAQVEILATQMFTAQLWSDSHLASTLLFTVWTGTHVQLIAWTTANANEDL